MSTTFFNNSDLEGQPVGLRSRTRRHVNSQRPTTRTQLFFTEEESSELRFSSFFGDDGSVFHNLQDFLDGQREFNWDSDELRVERVLELQQTRERLNDRGGEWRRRLRWG